jgi:hypothetical protein
LTQDKDGLRRLVGFFRQCLSYAFRSGSLHQSQAVRADKVSPCCFCQRRGPDERSIRYFFSPTSSLTCSATE